MNKTTIRNSLNILRIRKPILEFSKSFFNDACMSDVFYDVLSKKDHVVVLNQFERLHDFFNRVNPEMNNVVDSIFHNMPISDMNTVRFIRNDSKMSKCFVRVYNDYGKYVYVYDPVKADYKRRQRRENVRIDPFQKKIRYSWERENTNRDRRLLSENYARPDYRKQLPYSDDFINGGEVV